MPRLFDLHPATERLALLRHDAEGRLVLALRTLRGEPLGEVGAAYLPLGPHWSPDGAAVAFGSNDGLLYTHRPGEARPTAVFSHPELQAGFCEWTPDGRGLIFSAYDSAQGTPPDIYALALDTGEARRLTDDANAVDRFPHVSPSGRWGAFQRQFLDEPALTRSEPSHGGMFHERESYSGRP